MTKIIAFIPARSGSTRLKKKNIKKINKKPLIYWTVKRAVESNLFNKIIFSSDSDSYLNILIKSLKKNKISTKNIFFDKRNKIQASKGKKIFDYIKDDLIKKYNFTKKDLIVQMLPTAPLRSLKTIKEGIKLAKKLKKDIFSVSEYNFHLSFALSINKNFYWKELFKNSPLTNGNTQSQTQKKYYKPNPLINCIWVKNLTKKRKSIYENSLAIKTSKIEAIDIDDKDDFLIAESIMEKICFK